MLGGVMGSMAGGELVPLSSVISSRSPASLVDEVERLLASLLRLMLMLKWGRKDVLGDRLCSSLGDKSLEERDRDLQCLDSDTDGSTGARSGWGALKDSTKGTKTESLMSS